MQLSFDCAKNQYVVVTGNISDPEGYMYQSYLRLVGVLSEVVRRADGERRMISGGDYDSAYAPRTNGLYLYGNNVVAISGRRGQGKTSVMLSFSNALLGEKDHGGIWPEWLAHRPFLVLDPIDPTVLESSQSPLMLILSRMYRKVEETWERHLSPGQLTTSVPGVTDTRRRELVDRFQKCFSSIRAVKSTDGELDRSLASLHALSDSSKLKSDLYGLVESVLEFCHVPGDERGDSLLVVQLDDTDFQIDKGYEVLEDIRKYLTLPNVIILMATDMERMYEVVAQHFSEELGTALDRGFACITTVENNAHKYIDKLIPPSQVVHLPSLGQTMSRPDSFLGIRLLEGGRAILPASGEEDLALEDAVLRFLYRKTEILCIAKKGEVHGFIPSTLRGLMQLLNLLASLEDIPAVAKETKKDRYKLAQALEERLSIKERNLGVLEDYFLTTWVNAKFSSAPWRISVPEVARVLSRLADDPGLDELCLEVLRSLEANASPVNVQANDKTEDNAGDKTKDEKPKDDIDLVIDKVRASSTTEDRCFAAAIRMSIALRWHKATIRQMRSELSAMREPQPSVEGSAPSSPTYAFHLSPRQTGLPASFCLNTNAEDRGTLAGKVRRRLETLENEAEKEKNEAVEEKGRAISEVLAPGGEFRMLNITQAMLSMADCSGGTQLMSFSDIPQNIVYDAQAASLVVACSPELQREMIRVEESAINAQFTDGVSLDKLAEILQTLNKYERHVNAGQIPSSSDGHVSERLALIPECLRVGQFEEWIRPARDDLQENQLASWFSSLTPPGKPKKGGNQPEGDEADSSGGDSDPSAEIS